MHAAAAAAAASVAAGAVAVRRCTLRVGAVGGLVPSAVAGADATWLVDDAVCAVALTPDSRLLAAGSEEGEIVIVDLAAGGERRLAGHDGGTMALTWVRAPRGPPVGTAGWAPPRQRHYASSYRASPTERFRNLCDVYGRPCGAMGRPPSSWMLVSSGSDGCVRAWDGATGRLLCAAACEGTGGVSGVPPFRSNAPWCRHYVRTLLLPLPCGPAPTLRCHRRGGRVGDERRRAHGVLRRHARHALPRDGRQAGAERAHTLAPATI